MTLHLCSQPRFSDVTQRSKNPSDKDKQCREPGEDARWDELFLRALRRGCVRGGVQAAPKQSTAGGAAGLSGNLESWATGVLPHHCCARAVQCPSVQVSDREV